MTNLHNNIKDSLEPYEHEHFIVQHPAWGYYAHEYGLEQLAIESFGDTPTANELADIIDIAKEHNVKAVFVSPQFDTASAEAIASEIGGQIVTVDSLAEDYIINLRDITDKLLEAFDNGR